MMSTHLASSSQLSPLESYLHEIDETSLLTAKEEKELAYRIAEGDREARDHLVRANLRLVVSIARGFQGKGVDMSDLIAEGNLGLLRASEGFDPSMNCRFSTYAVYWVKQSIRRAVVNSADKTIRLPTYMVQLLNEWRRETARLQDELGRQPTDEEVASSLKLKPRKLRLIKKAIRIHNAVPQGNDEDESVSLDALLGSERGPMTESGPEHAAELQEVLQLVDRLDQRARTVLSLRFGLDGQETKTLQEIGKRLHLTRERVRQIELEALSQLNEMLVGA